MRIEHLVKTYRLINDPEAPNWSIKFAGVVGAVALAVAAVGAVAWASQQEGDAGGSAVAARSGSGEQTEYVGLDPLLVKPGLPLPGSADAELAQWQSEHPDARILSKEPVTSGGRLIGYNIRYTS